MSEKNHLSVAELGRKQLDADHAEAVESLQTACQAQPDNWELWILLAHAHCRAHERSESASDASVSFGAAVTAFGEGLKRSPDYDLAWTRARNSIPRAAEPWGSRGKGGDGSPSARAFRAAMRDVMPATPRTSGEWRNKGTAELCLGDADAAISAYRTAVELAPAAYEAWYYLGRTYYYQSRFADASLALEQAVRAKPDFVDAWASLGYAYSHRESHSEAARVHKRLEALDPARAKVFWEELNRNK